jgi:hypothetical protein
MGFVSLTCHRCSGTGKKPGLLDADQVRPSCSYCEGSGSQLAHTGSIRSYSNGVLIRGASTLLWAGEDPTWPQGPEQLELFYTTELSRPLLAENQGDQDHGADRQQRLARENRKTDEG